MPDDLEPVYVGDSLPGALNEQRDTINEIDGIVDGKVTMPSGAQTGDLLWWDGTAWVTTETRFFEGTGSPNGVVSGPVGSRYVDKAGSGGSVDWVKTGGGGSNTGWTARGATAAGGIKACTAGAANAQVGPIFVAFPAGRFSEGPAVSATANDATVTGVWTVGATAGGFNLYFKCSVAGKAFSVNWTAVAVG